MSTTAPRRVYLDLTHLGRHVTGIERVAIEQFEKVVFEDAEFRPVRASGLISMLFRQQILLPLLAVLSPGAAFIFPGFPPSPLFALIPHRVILYVHDTFLISRPHDLSRKARLYLAPQFRIAVRRLQRFLVNSEKTRGELRVCVRPNAEIALYRPAVANVFGLSAQANRAPKGPLRLVTLGTVEPRKNYKAALAILDGLRAGAHADAELHVIGRPGWGDDAALIASHPAAIVHGYLAAPDAKRVLEGADIYLCTAHDEGLGLPLLEAQYAGLPVIAPDKPIFREVLGVSGTFIDPAKPSAAAAAIAALLSTPGWRAMARTQAAANIARWNVAASADLAHIRSMFAEGGAHAVRARAAARPS